MDINKFLERNLNSALLRISMVGNSDDGKSTLIGRLLDDAKVYEDQPKVAKDNGSSKESSTGVAYHYFSTPKRNFIIVDTPGHEQYTRDMVTGASTADLAIVLVDASKGLTTQSKRNAFILSLLGISHIVVAVNKMDIVDYSEEVFEKICGEYSVFCDKLEVKNIKFIPLSALKGDNVVNKSGDTAWYKGESLLQHLESVYTSGDKNVIDFRFPVQRVSRSGQGFKGFCGTVSSGIVRVGDEVMALPAKKVSKVKRIVSLDGDLEYAFPVQPVTICLDDEIDIGRGDMLVHPKNQPDLTYKVEAMVIWLSEEPLKQNESYFIKHTTKTVRGCVSQLFYKIAPEGLHRQETNGLKLNEIARATVQLFQPLPSDPYARNKHTGSFIVIDPKTNRTVAAGMIIDRQARREQLEIGKDVTPVSRNIYLQGGKIEVADRENLLGQKGVTIWLTGLSGAGKSTVGFELEKRLIAEGRACYVLDGDNVRHGLNRDLGFSPSDRKENIRRIAEVSRLFNNSGIIVISSFISPYRSDRSGARDIAGDGRFVEVFVDAPIEVCEQRDPKKLYAKARRGEIPEFTGITAPYEAPEEPEVHLRTDLQSVDESVDTIFTYLKAIGFLTNHDPDD